MQYRIVFKHLRYDKVTGKLKPYRKGKSNWTPTEKGGHTYCLIYGSNDEFPIVKGKAKCNVLDTFCYRLGRMISQGRAMRALEIRESFYPYEKFSGLWSLINTGYRDASTSVPCPELDSISPCTERKEK